MQNPQKYETNKSIAKDAIELFVPKLLKSLRWKTNEIVLDYGSGAGSTGYDWILPKVEKCNSRMFSVDMSPEMLAYAMEHYPHERITYDCGNILDSTFPFEDLKFDKIISVNVLHFIRDIRKALAGFHKMLKSGGQLGFLLPLAGNTVTQTAKKLADSKTWNPYMRDYDNFYADWSLYPKGEERRGMHELLESSGFHVVELEVHQRDFHFDPIDTFLEFSLSVNPCVGNIPTNLHKLFKEDMRKIITRSAGIPVDSKAIDASSPLAWGVVTKGHSII
ncbi:Juvenile hormone acid O-methyltransferase [Orchesella cincta]|uniref:Juvenile hormone acid O-methyltransferase n=1 Tax=Orchesella cincta TaxID=48709 RepID=A0A1D2M6E9_ORCCI|nr:Juvenile hormone acid O-methyltransferase [Orchesella cincta]